MKSCKSKYPIKAGPVLIPAGAEGEILPSLTARMLSSFPNLRQRAGGELLLVKFDGALEILVKKDQVTY